MQYYIVTDGVITSLPVVDFDNPLSVDFATKQGWALGEEGYAQGDTYDPETGEFTHTLPTPPKPVELQTDYETRTAQYIHERYPIDKEQAITRKAIAYPDNADTQARFSEYNTYAEECKARAHDEVFGVGV